jgi:hypothetical protein
MSGKDNKLGRMVEKAKVNNSQSARPSQIPIVSKKKPTFNPAIYELKETPPNNDLPSGFPAIPEAPGSARRMSNESFVTNTYQNLGPEPKGRIHADETDNSSVLSDVKNQAVVEDLGSFPQFSHLITHTYWGPMTQNSTTLDIIAVYLKGQKILYIDSKNYCEQKLNYLMMPTIFITAVCSIISMVLKDYDFGATLVSCLAGLSTFILSIISYLKLDAKSEAHKTSAYQFDKAQTMCEFFSGKVLLIKDNDVDKKVQDFVTQIEKKVEEIKDVNQFIIPEAIRYRYPKIYAVNVFSEIKRYKNREKILRNELHYIFQKIDNLNASNQPIPEELNTIKEHKLKEVLEYQDEYFKLDDQFEEEVNEYVNSQRNKKGCCSKRKDIHSNHIKSSKPKTPTPPKLPLVPIHPQNPASATHPQSPTQNKTIPTVVVTKT